MRIPERRAATLTISTNGVFRGKECHEVADISHTRVWGTYTDGEIAPSRCEVRIKMDIGQALAIAYDLLYQAVDAGALAGWSVQLPDENFERLYRKA